MPRVLGVIPARYASTRFPGKLLAPLGDRTLIEEVWRRASTARRLDRLIIATDDERIAGVATAFGAETMLTSAAHASGTDRVAEVAEKLGETYSIIINIQGDEPLIAPASLDRLALALHEPSTARMATLSEPIASLDELFDPNVVKVVTDHTGRALYFSRLPIPFYRPDSERLAPDFRAALEQRPERLAGYRKHQGLYAYTRPALLALSKLEPSPLELQEGLEQLRALEAGYDIQVIASDYRSIGVDTPDDLKRVAETIANGGASR